MYALRSLRILRETINRLKKNLSEFIYYTIYTLHNIGNNKIDKQPKAFIHKFEVGEQLLMMHRLDVFYRFKFYDDLIINKEIKSKTFTDIHPFVAHCYFHLRLHRDTCEGKFMDESFLIGSFE